MGGRILLQNAPMHFAPENGVAFFEELGWGATEVRSVLHAAGRWGRLPWMLRLFSKLPEPNPRKLGRHVRWSGVATLEKR